MATNNDYLIYNQLCTARSYHRKDVLHDKLLFNRYSSLDLSTLNQISKCRHKAAVLSLDVEQGENRYLLAAGQIFIKSFYL